MLEIRFSEGKVRVVLAGDKGQPHIDIEKDYADVRVFVTKPGQSVMDEAKAVFEVLRAGMSCVLAIHHARKASEGTGPKE